MEQIILFGDSITQQSADQARGFAFTPAVQNDYIRRLDVINRGFSGYNTNQALVILPRIVPSPSCSRIRIFSVFFGANDARLPNTGAPEQHVPLDQYKINLAKILDDTQLRAHDPKFVLITPPPVEERKCMDHDVMMTGGATKPIKRRTAEATASYAQAVRELGKERNIAVVDLWTALMNNAGWDGDSTKPLPGSTDAPKNEYLRSILHDGLHFNGLAYDVLHKEWIATVSSAYPELAPTSPPEVLPRWDHPTAWGV